MYALIIKKLKVIIDKVPLWGWIFIFGAVLFCTYDINISADMSDYMNLGFNIYTGKGYVNLDNSLVLDRPLFPLMIALSFWLLGPSPWSAFWVVRIFAVLTPVLVYFLGKNFYSKKVGFCAALLILSSYSMNFWSYRHIDTIWPFFSLLFLLFLYKGFRDRKMLYFAIAAVSISLSYFVKQASLLLSPLPFLVWLIVKGYRNKKTFIGTVLYLLVLITGLFLGVWAVYYFTGSLDIVLLSRGGKTAVESLFTQKLFSFARLYFTGIRDYYTGYSNSLSANFPFAFLFILSWLFVLRKAFKKHSGSIILTISLILLSPYIAFVGKNNLRVGQLLLFISLTYIGIADFLLDEEVNNFIIEVYRRYKGVVLIAFLVIVEVLFTYNHIKSNLYFLRRTRLVRKIAHLDSKPRIKGVYGDDFGVPVVARWIMENLPAGEKIMVDWYFYQWALYFYTQGKYSIYSMPIRGELSDLTTGKYWEGMKKDVLLISAWTDKYDPRNSLFLLSEQELLEKIQERGVRYLVITQRWGPLADYFYVNSGFEEKISFQTPDRNVKKVIVFAVKNIRPVENLKPIITPRAISFLTEMRKKDIEHYNEFVRSLFFGTLGWNERKLGNILEHKEDEQNG